ncbi:hypothetical protein CK203_004920 [Vitis vinifera]|uniref:Uncharacterized protein n=1 Tax=Vitis vinifera TaxID=29760 RepID=A0A438KFG8_VITVI|nr:hypothetical protein CK203_004920 [Vitis vinifera]
MMKLFDLSKARVRVVMKERSILLALIEVLDGGREFTVSVAMTGEEDIRRGREMGESTQQKLEPHLWTGGKKRAEEAKSTAVGRASNGAISRMKEGKVCQKVEFALVGTHGKRRPIVGTTGPNHPNLSLAFVVGPRNGRQTTISTKGSLRRDDPFAKGKGKVGYEASEAQSRGSVLKCGSKKLWNALFPPSSGCRQGGRSPSEPLTLERLSLASDDLPKEDSFEVGTQLERSFSASPSRSSGSRKGVWGLGRNVAAKWRRGSKSSLSLLPPPSGLALPYLSPSVPVLPNSAIQSQFPTKP